MASSIYFSLIQFFIMYQLLRFFSRLKVFFTFLFLEIIAVWLIVNNNSYQQVAFLTSANAVAGNLYEVKESLTGQFNLRSELEQLQLENARLKARNESTGKLDNQIHLLNQNYNYIPARVINNSVSFEDNFLTLNRGTNAGIKNGMGVIAPNGLIGRIKSVTNNFAAVYSLLHSNIRVSAQLKKSKELCTVKWNADGTRNDYRQAELLYVPIHIDIQPGDTVETSGYNTIYPEGVHIGTVSSVKEDISDGRKKVKINLLVNFNNIKNVYVIENYAKNEIDSLTQVTTPETN